MVVERVSGVKVHGKSPVTGLALFLLFISKVVADGGVASVQCYNRPIALSL